MNEANLTRFGPKILEREQDRSTTFSATFNAIDGPGKLILQGDGIDDAQIKVNGHNVVEPQDARGKGEVVVPLTLKKENTIETNVPGGPAGTLGVRVTQVTRADLGLLRQGYFGLNTSNIERQRAFYDTLGFLGEIYPARPDQVDDLKKVRGIARVMEQKLNAAGIYTFAQIARWSDAAAAEFGRRLAIIGNVDRYNWREQCAKLHREKYHESA